MDGNARRRVIVAALEKSGKAITGASLAEETGVSRQVIVQDIALLRAGGVSIVSTAEGYMLYASDGEEAKRVFCVNHGEAQLEKELYIFVDNGGRVMNIIVEHSVYGEISVDLHLNSRRQVKNFLAKIEEADFVPLMTLTQGEHYHTIGADSEGVLDDIEGELREAGFLVE